MKDTADEHSGLSAENPYADYTVCDYAGEEIAEVNEFFVNRDDHTEYVSVKIGFLDLKSTPIPVDVTRVNEQRRLVEVAVTRERIEDTLALEVGSETTYDFDQQVRSFFGVTNDGILEVPPADWTVPLLLIRLREGDCPGGALARKVAYRGLEGPTPWTAYRALQQMEKEGIIVSRGNGSDRQLSWRRYSITNWGHTYLEYLANALAEYGEETDVFFWLFNKPLADEPRLEQRHLLSERETREHAPARN